MNEGEHWNLLKKYISSSDSIADTVCDFFFSDNQKYILGTGRQAAVVLEICRNFKTDISGLIIEPSAVFFDKTGMRKGYWKKLVERVPIILLDDLKDKDGIQVLMTVGYGNYDACEDILLKRGVAQSSIFRCDWEHNTDLRSICHRVYVKEFSEYLGE